MLAAATSPLGARLALASAHSQARQALSPRAHAARQARGGGNEPPTYEEVSRLVIQPLFRTTPQATPGALSQPVRVLILGESNLCRSPIAAALLEEALSEAGLANVVGCTSKGVQNYAKGDGMPASVIEVCEAAGINFDTARVAKVWRPEWDVCDFDLLVGVDRYVAADAMKEVAVWDTIQKEVEYSARIRGLYEFGEHEIDDPLYGNAGGEQERDGVVRAIAALRIATKGLVAALVAKMPEGAAELASKANARDLLSGAVEAMLQDMGPFEWNAPPMLSKRASQFELDEMVAPPLVPPAAASPSDGLFDLTDVGGSMGR